MEMFNSIQWLGKTIIIQKQNICPWILLGMLFIGDDGADFFFSPHFHICHFRNVCNYSVIHDIVNQPVKLPCNDFDFWKEL